LFHIQLQKKAAEDLTEKGVDGTIGILLGQGVSKETETTTVGGKGVNHLKRDFDSAVKL